MNYAVIIAAVLFSVIWLGGNESASAGPKQAGNIAANHLHQLSCAEGQVARFEGGEWVCAEDLGGACSVSTKLAITSIECADGTSASTPDILAVAYINDDGQQGYSPSRDMLIAGLFDANFDGVASVGDVVKLDQYPLGFEASGRGNFQTKTHTVTLVPVSQTDSVGVRDGNDNSWVWSVRNRVSGLIAPGGSFESFNSTTGGTVFIADGENVSDKIRVSTGLPNNADTEVDVSAPNAGDEVFVDVNIFSNGELVVPYP